MPTGNAAYQALQNDEIIRCPREVRAVVQRQFVLAGRVLRYQGLERQILGRRCGVDVAEQTLHAVQFFQTVDLGAVGRPPVERRWCCPQHPVRTALAGKEEELELEGAGGMEAALLQQRQLAYQCVARVGRARYPFEVVHRDHHLAARRRRPGQRLQGAGDRPDDLVAVAVVPDEACFLDVLARDVESENGGWQVAPVPVQGQEFVAADHLAAADPVGIDDDDIDGLDVGVTGQEFLCLRYAGAARYMFIQDLLSRVTALSRRKARQGRGEISVCDRPAPGRVRRRRRRGDRRRSRSWPGRRASCCGRARSGSRD